MTRNQDTINPGVVLQRIYGRTSKQLKMSEKRRDEVIAAAIFACFRNQEFGSQYKLPKNYQNSDHEKDARGIDIELSNAEGRIKRLQIKGIHLKRSVERRRHHQTKGVPKHLGRRTRKWVEQDSKEIASVLGKELKKIVHDYTGLILVIHVMADLATQTSIEIALRKSQKIVENLKAKEIWFIRNVPVRALQGKSTKVNCYTYQLMEVAPYKHTYSFSFAL